MITDGPRPGIAADVEKCREVRQILDGIDWPCEVLRNYASLNLGCAHRLATGITWVFEQVAQAIVLEDDVVPHPSFFGYCEELLERYRDDARVMMISGTNVLGEWQRDSQSYHFSYYGGIHGWASWHRAWQHFDLAIARWQDSQVRRRLRDILVDPLQYEYRASLYDRMCRNEKVTTWDYQWGFARLIQSGLSIVPSGNLIRNIGFDENATHTAGAWFPACGHPVIEADLPLRHPDYVMVDRKFDDRMFRALLPGWKSRVRLRWNAWFRERHGAARKAS